MLGVKVVSVDKDGKIEFLWDIMDWMSKFGKVVWLSGDLVEKKFLDIKYEVFLD